MKKGWMKKSADRSFLFQRGGREGGPGGAKICQSQVSPFQGGQGFASTICNALREFQHCQ